MKGNHSMTDQAISIPGQGDLQHRRVAGSMERGCVARKKDELPLAKAASIGAHQGAFGHRQDGKSRRIGVADDFS